MYTNEYSLTMSRERKESEREREREREREQGRFVFNVSNLINTSFLREFPVVLQSRE